MTTRKYYRAVIQQTVSEKNNQQLVTPKDQERTVDFKTRALIEACTDGDVYTVKKLLTERRGKVHQTTEDGESLLSLACAAGHYDVAQVLLTMDANVEGNGDCTPLMEAASGGHVNVVQLLLSNGADVNAKSAKLGNTPLMYGCANGHEKVVNVLLQNGANVEVHNGNGHTALMKAASAGHIIIVRILSQAISFNTNVNNFNDSALTLSLTKGHINIYRFLLEFGAEERLELLAKISQQKSTKTKQHNDSQAVKEVQIINGVQLIKEKKKGTKSGISDNKESVETVSKNVDQRKIDEKLNAEESKNTSKYKIISTGLSDNHVVTETTNSDKISKSTTSESSKKCDNNNKDQNNKINQDEPMTNDDKLSFIVQPDISFVLSNLAFLTSEHDHCYSLASQDLSEENNLWDVSQSYEIYEEIKRAELEAFEKSKNLLLEEKKQSQKIYEQIKRAKLKEAFNELKSLLPEKEMTQAETLLFASNYLKELDQRVRALDERTATLKQEQIMLQQLLNERKAKLSLNNEDTAILRRDLDITDFDVPIIQEIKKIT